MAINGETLGWTIFTWVIMWLCIFRGVGLTGRVVYFTMGIPLTLIVILIGRSAALPNAIDGVRLYMGTWDSAQLASANLWQEACGQIFFSAGIGMGYYTSYASYNAKYSNAVQDAFIIGVSNMFIEAVAAFAVFSVVGYLGMNPKEGEPLDSFTAAFLTYPEALAQMPGANFWAIIFFATLFLLGMSSAFAMLEAMVTGIIDTDWGKKYPRPVVVTGIMLVSMLISVPFTTEFGYDMLSAADTWVNYLALFFIVWAEATCATTLYRYQDIVDQCGLPAYVLYNIGYLGGQVSGFSVGHAVGPEAGAGVGFGLFIVCAIAAVLVAKTPEAETPRFWGTSGPIVRKFWWLAFYAVSRHIPAPCPAPLALTCSRATSCAATLTPSSATARTGRCTGSLGPFCATSPPLSLACFSRWPTLASTPTARTPFTLPDLASCTLPLSLLWPVSSSRAGSTFSCRETASMTAPTPSLPASSSSAPTPRTTLPMASRTRRR